MKLSELINSALSDREIIGITCDSREVKPGYLFACINGPERDGHDFAASALEKGAAAILCERDLGFDNQIIVENTKHIYPAICQQWYGNAASKLKLIGVTGTNGKTSITYLIKNMLENMGSKCGLIGTIQNICGDKIFESKNTTPSIENLHRYFSYMVEEGCEYCVMEVSSHALEQERVFGLEFETAIFTNLTQDHLDYHKTMENYLAAKKKLFYNCKNAVINIDDRYAAELMRGLGCNILTYSINDNTSDFQAKNIRYTRSGNDFELLSNGVISRVSLNIPGKFSVYNALAAGACGICLGFSIEGITQSLSKAKGIKGRAEVVPTDTDYSVIIDYAHTPDGIA
ncbi:MAG: UDP-N-acetylmuramoyl-L-alanyl-D-glutamate--2,6-diaminopimelate ligase, partial [Oscillospiraceae bacterium]|nr:UDP-N-acetylmuramoyl-L-alanyl-D-glutamate--2,6-diaminopimelate ligase [Candidatus Equicaccousia limihippi]